MSSYTVQHYDICPMHAQYMTYNKATSKDSAKEHKVGMHYDRNCNAGFRRSAKDKDC